MNRRLIEVLKTVVHPPEESWSQLLQRPANERGGHIAKVNEVLRAVRTEGDAALIRLTREFDGVDITATRVSPEVIEGAGELVSDELKAAISLAKENITRFHAAQVRTEPVIETVPGVRCWRKSVGIDKVGLYIPGGTAPLFSTVLMLGIPAALAGCREIILCTPPQKNGEVHPATLYAAKEAGIRTIFRVGGAQAIAAMAFGTATIPAVYKIFGPGNQYVDTAKQLVQEYGVSIDMPAGPSEVCILADDSADASFIAADLLSQAEHGPDSQVLLVTTSESLAEMVVNELTTQLGQLPRKDFAAVALEHSKIIVMPDMQQALKLVNAYAAEHLIICCVDGEMIADQVTNAGSVFIGNYTPESAGDYASGTNHTLPTNGMARSYSGVSVDSFVKKISFQQITRDGLAVLAPAIMTMASEEGLQAHANAVDIRLSKQPRL